MVRAVILAISLLLLIACANQKALAPVIGVAYAGPATLSLRKDISPQSPVVGTVKHGDRLELIQHRRRLMKVRTVSGIEGWTDEHLLLSPQEIVTLQAFEKGVRTLPSQGVATTYDVLIVHIEPDRLSPSFVQLKEGEKFDVIAHRVVPRMAQPRKQLVTPPAKKAKTVAKKSRGEKVPPPPMPAPPGVPADWLALSQTTPESQAAKAAAKLPEPPALEDWSLIRTSRGESGWVITRRLFMAIPDEVAQYAEGHRIASYIPLGDVTDAGKVKHTWLWTTMSQTAQPYDFDSFRVFIWSIRHHRYETSYIERNLKGYFPVLAEQAPYGGPVKARGTKAGAKADANATAGVSPGFSVCVQKKDGNHYRRSYALLANVVRFAGEKPCEVQAIESPKVSGEALVAQAQQPPGGNAGRSFFGRLKGRLSGLRQRLFGK